MSVLIGKDDSRWEAIYKLWKEEKQPGYVVLPGGEQYRVHQPGDDTVLFELMEGIDSLYNSRSTRAISR